MSPVVMYRSIQWGQWEIQRVEVDKVSQLYVWRDGERWPRRSPTSRSAYFDTWEEAHKSLLDNATENLDAYRNKVMIAQERVMTIQGMKQP